MTNLISGSGGGGANKTFQITANNHASAEATSKVNSAPKCRLISSFSTQTPTAARASHNGGGRATGWLAGVWLINQRQVTYRRRSAAA